MVIFCPFPIVVGSQSPKEIKKSTIIILKDNCIVGYYAEHVTHLIFTNQLSVMQIAFVKDNREHN